VGSAGLGLASGDSYKARLVLTTDAGDTVCEAEEST
jgi:hypothetical protein